MANYTDTSGHDRPSRFPDSRQNSTNKLASLKARDESVTSHQRTKNNVWRMDWFSIILLGCYLAFFSFIFPPIFFFAVFFPPACCVIVLIFHVRSSKPLFSFCLSVLATCACVYLQNLLATTQTWRRCPLFWLPCDVVLTVFRNKLEWQDAARCAASFSRPPLLTSICHCLPPLGPRWFAPNSTIIVSRTSTKAEN